MQAPGDSSASPSGRLALASARPYSSHSSPLHPRPLLAAGVEGGGVEEEAHPLTKAASVAQQVRYALASPSRLLPIHSALLLLPACALFLFEPPLSL